jgi:hypothetical protein
LHCEHALLAVQLSFGRQPCANQIRRYIHDLEARCDMSGDVQTIALLREDRDALLRQTKELGQASEFLLSGCLVGLLRSLCKVTCRRVYRAFYRPPKVEGRTYCPSLLDTPRLRSRAVWGLRTHSLFSLSRLK